ncbi:MAG: peptidylprolyl isomerase [candidate division WS1 bacterium]|nr:peptidylprolyl isomerase [candidate division WS1 bacterium]
MFVAIVAYAGLQKSVEGKARHPASQAQAVEAEKPVGDEPGDHKPAQFDGAKDEKELEQVTETPTGTETASAAVIKTSKGDIRVKLYANDAPKTVANFVSLSKKGFYDGLTFHRVIRPFMIQAGCPRGDGTGGPGYNFEDEFNQHKIIAGTLAMANAGPNTNGSQFFIVTESPQPHLDGRHTAFGQVTEGMDVVRAIASVPTGMQDRPLEPVTIKTIETIAEEPAAE